MEESNSTPYPVYKIACGGEIRDISKYPSAMYRGEKVYFCTQECLKTFLADPGPFMAGEIEHPA